MSNIIPFPTKPTLSRKPVMPPIGIIGFQASVFLVEGKSLAFTIKYPDGPIAWKLVAKMLREAAKTLEESGKK